MKVVDGRVSLTVREAEAIREHLLDAAKKHDRDGARARDATYKLDLPRSEIHRRRDRIIRRTFERTSRVVAVRTKPSECIKEAKR
jgi:hypothetical protein